jgi:hypothetical protein
MFGKKMNLTFLVIILFALSSFSFAQDAKDSIFGDVQKKIDEARELGAELLSPE